ncbi:MAG TPA: hypothetical protein VFX59_26330 [Polyangiales bacterium]|nr:hypothetical protein [Polyangiales bacterium]
MNVGLAVLFAALSCVGLYLCSPHQRLRSTPLPTGAARGSAGLLACASLVAFSRAMHVLPAVFASVTCLMLFLVAVPYLGAAFGAARKER